MGEGRVHGVRGHGALGGEGAERRGVCVEARRGCHGETETGFVGVFDGVGFAFGHAEVVVVFERARVVDAWVFVADYEREVEWVFDIARVFVFFGVGDGRIQAIFVELCECPLVYEGFVGGLEAGLEGGR